MSVTITKITEQIIDGFEPLHLTGDEADVVHNASHLTYGISQLTDFTAKHELFKEAEDLYDIFDGINDVYGKVMKMLPKSEGESIIKIPLVVQNFFTSIGEMLTDEKVVNAVEYGGIAYTVVALPLAIRDVIAKLRKATEEFVEKEYEFSVDNFMAASYETAKILGSASGLIKFFVRVELVAKSAMSALPYLGSAGIAFGSLGVVKSITNAYQLNNELHTYSAIIAKHGKNRDKCYVKVQEYVNSLGPKKAKKLFGRDTDWLQKRLPKDDPTVSKKEIAYKIDTAIFALEDRIRASRNGQLLNSGAGVTWLIANTAFVFAPVALGVPYLLLSAAVFSLSKDANGWMERNRFRNVMEGVTTAA